MGLSYFDITYITRSDFGSASVVIYEDTFSFQNIVRFCITNMLVPSDGAVRMKHDLGEHLSVTV